MDVSQGRRATEVHGRLTAAAPDGPSTFEPIRGNDKRPPRVRCKRWASGDYRKATQSIYRNPKTASAVWLPIVEK